MKKKLSSFQQIGIAFILIYIILFIYRLPRGLDSNIWYCDWVLLFSGTALLLKNKKATSVFLVQCLMVQTPWLIDAVYYGLFSKSLIGVSAYLYGADYTLINFIISLRHFIVIPALLIYFTKNKFDKKYTTHLLYSTLTFIFILTISLFGIPANNSNCIYKPCMTIYPNLKPWILYLVSFYIFLLTLQFIMLKFTEFIINLSNKNKNKATTYTILIFIILTLLTTLKYISIHL